jgi:hypothetical protein
VQLTFNRRTALDGCRYPCRRRRVSKNQFLIGQRTPWGIALSSNAPDRLSVAM